MFKVITIPSPNKNIYEVGKASIILSALQMGKQNVFPKFTKTMAKT